MKKSDHPAGSLLRELAAGSIRKEWETERSFCRKNAPDQPVFRMKMGAHIELPVYQLIAGLMALLALANSLASLLRCLRGERRS